MLRGMFGGNTLDDENDRYESISPRKPTNLDHLLSNNIHHYNSNNDGDTTQPQTDYTY